MVLAVAATAQTPPKTVEEPPPAIPPKTILQNEWNTQYQTQDVQGKVYKWSGNPVEFEDSRMLFRADYVEYNQDTGDLIARGHVYFHQFASDEKIWCDHLEYNTDEETGKFYDVRGETMPRIIARTGVLTVKAPFHFEGEWAERIGEKYILYNGWVTNCKLPNPWWRLRGPKFDIIPGKRALAYRSWFKVRKLPIFYAPFFYHSLEKEPRKSGFLMPSAGHSSQGGFLVEAGYFWAINRSYDFTYRVTDYISRGYAHHFDFRGKPRPGTDFDIIAYGVDDREGDPTYHNKYSGLSIFAVGHSDLGHGWSASAAVNYITSLRFKGNWSQSYSDLVASDLNSIGVINKNWSTFTFNVILDRLRNYQDNEKQITNLDGSKHYETDAVTIRKLPELELGSRDHQIWKHVPLWFSFQSSAGLLNRSEPYFNTDGNAVTDRFETGNLVNRLNFAPHLTGAFHWGGIHLVPSLGFQETSYSEAQTPYLDHYRVIGTDIVRSTRDFSLDVILPSIERVFQKKTIFGDKLKHVIEPRATYRYVTGVGTDFDRFIRFDENELVSNTNELAYSVTNRIYAKRGDNVHEIFSWELMQKRYFDPTFGGALVQGQRNVFASTADLTAYAFLLGPRSSSPVVSLLHMNLVGGLGVTWQADYDHRRADSDQRRGIVDSSFSVDYRWKNYFVNVTNNETHPDPLLTAAANQYQFRVQAGDPNHRGVSAGMTGIYDYRQGVMQYTTAQVTYNTDCCGWSVQYYRKYGVGTGANAVPGDGQFRVAFSIGNIGTFGNLKKQERLF